jgi:hypothetical protein
MFEPVQIIHLEKESQHHGKKSTGGGDKSNPSYGKPRKKCSAGNLGTIIRLTQCRWGWTGRWYGYRLLFFV